MNQLAVFKGKNIRRILHNKEWWFSIIDVVEALTESPDSAVYWRVLKHRLKEEGGNETVTKCNGLKMEARDGKQRETDCATAGGKIAGDARNQLEHQTGRRVVSKQTYLGVNSSRRKSVSSIQNKV